MRKTYKYKVFLSVDNFQTNADRLVFDDFTIKSLQRGSQEAAKWKRKLHSKIFPQHILTKDFKNYVIDENDVSGFDNIVHAIKDLLIVFRLFKPGDLFFNEILIKDIDTGNTYLSLYKSDDISIFKYTLKAEDIADFVKFKRSIMPKIKLRTSFINYSLNSFMSGANRSFYYNIKSLLRIVDYVIALESLFLIDENHWFLRSTLANRVSNFLRNQLGQENISDIKSIIKFMYDERSKIVHGNYIDLTEQTKAKLMNKLKKKMLDIESIMRMVFNKMLDLDSFKSKREIENYMKKLYSLPDEVTNIMEKAKKESETLLGKRS
ncbi:MAG: hypothetical protein FJ242_05415 [Nitrospira sp.]|nr:hypothetical protein [Nitrospira sp.]